MMNITKNDVNKMDLNLLRVLDMVLQEGSATGAARRLHVTQSAVSNALARLRAMFGDPLVTRSGKGLAPTPMGLRLKPVLAHALAQVEDVLTSQLLFDPRTTTRRFTLACTDAHHFHDVPQLAAAMARRLPHATLHIVSPDTMESLEHPASGTLDGVLCPRQGVPPGQPFTTLYDEGFAFVVRRDHPVVGRTLGVKQFNAARHVDTLIVQGRGGVGHKMASEIFAQLGLVRDVALSVPTFSAAGMAAARSDLVAGLPARLAGILCTLLPLRQVRGPLPVHTFPMVLTWSPAVAQDVGSQFFRNVVVETLGPRRATRPRNPRHPG
jgi:DNA-binding transcriptional LysR family regulator